MSVLPHYDYRCAGCAPSNRSHSLNAGIAVDANIEQKRPCGFFRGVSYAITERSIEPLDIAKRLLKQRQFDMLRHHSCESARRLAQTARRQR
nr:hypothetical protein [Mesorhizobium tamadayense]